MLKKLLRLESTFIVLSFLVFASISIFTKKIYGRISRHVGFWCMYFRLHRGNILLQKRKKEELRLKSLKGKLEKEEQSKSEQSKLNNAARKEELERIEKETKELLAKKSSKSQAELLQSERMV